MLIRATRKNSKTAKKPNTASKSKTSAPKRSIKTIRKVSKKAQANKKATAARVARAPKPLDPEKQRARDERDRQRAERQKIKDEKLRIKMLKEQAKLEKLKMWELKPNTSIQVPKTNALFRNPWSSLDFSSVFLNNRKPLSCVYKNDIDGLKACLEQTEHISNPFQQMGVDCQLNIIKLIVAQENTQMFQLVIDYLIKEKKDEIKRVKLADIALQKTGTGQSNKFSFNFPIRQVKLSRGGKEGNNAFTYDSKIRKMRAIEAEDILKLSPPMSFVKIMLESKSSGSDKGPAYKKNKKGFLKQQDLKAFWVKAARRGDYALLRHILKVEKGDSSIYGFGRLHQAAILQGSEAEAVKILKRQTLIKPTPDDHAIVPMHLACINPDPAILKNFFRMYPTSFQTDGKGRDLIHYAAANKNPDILEFLIQKRQIINNADNEGLTPMMVACKLGRIKSVQLLLEDQAKQQAALDPKDSDYQHYASFYSYMDTPGPFQNTPLHYAAKHNSIQIVKALVVAGANLELKNFYSETPFAIACAQGNLEIAEYLLDKGANIHGADKQQKSPLIKACINGQDHIVCLLLRRGVNANFCDISENTALHYAAAYGWLEIVKLLVEKGHADVNRLNEWKSSPTIIAMLKGHFGIVDYLLSQKDINASLVDDQGRSLVSQLCMTINEDSAKNLKFLLQKSNIDVKKVDSKGFSALHHLCNINVTVHTKELVQNKEEVERNQYYMRRGKKIKMRSYSNRRYGNHADFFVQFMTNTDEKKEFNTLLKKLIQVQIQCANLLIEKGLRPDLVTNKETGQCSPVFLAVMSNNFELAEEIFDQAIKIKPKDDEVYDYNPVIMGKTDKKENFLHLFAFEFMQYPHGIKLLERISRDKTIVQDLKKMSLEPEHEGLTPFLCYFRDMKDTMHDYKFTNCLSNVDTTDYAIQTFIPDAIKTIKQACALFVNVFKYDVSSRSALSQSLKDEAKELLDTKAINQQQYNQLVNLEFPQQGGNVLDPIESEGHYDDILSFDPLKSQLGLLNKEDDTKADDDSSDDDDSVSTKSSSKSKFDPMEFVKDEEYCLDTAAHILLKGLNNIEQRMWDKAKAKTVLDQLNSIFGELLSHSRSFLQPSKKNLAVGFNKVDKQGNTCLFAALREKNTSAALLMINSQMLDITAKKDKSHLTALHLIASLVTQEATLRLIFNKIDKPKLLTEDRNGNTPLHYAAYARNLAMVTLLIESVPNVKSWINKANAFGATALHLSLLGFDEKLDHTPALERLLIQHGANARALDENKRSPLFYLFFKKKPQKAGQQVDPANALITLLKEASLVTKDLTIADKNAYTLLHHACIAGATICALTLINNGCDTRSTNILNNTPFAESLAYEQQQICMFMIQNNCQVNEQVHYLEYKNATSKLEAYKKMILPAELHKEWFMKATAEQMTPKESLLKDYKVKSFTPFQKAMECGWGGIGYLLLSKNFQAFEALAGCLKAHKYESFLDMLNSVDKAIINSVDSKGRTLLHILLRHLGERDDLLDDSPELKRAFEIMDFLTSQHKFNINQQDLRGYNLLHTVALKGNTVVFKYLLLKVSKSQALTWLKEKASARHQAAPLALLVMRHDFETVTAFNELLQHLHKLFSVQQIRDLPNSYLEDSVDMDEQKIPDYLDFSKPYCTNKEKGRHSSNLVFSIFNKHIEMGQQLITDSDESYEFLTRMVPFFDTATIGQSQCSVLQHCVKMCESGPLFQFLLGSFKNENGDVRDNRKPRVDINYKDTNGMTALHYALVPALDSKKGRRQNTFAIETLLSKGASPLLRDKLNRTAVDLASSNKSLRELFAPYVKEFKEKPLSSEFEIQRIKPDEVYVDILKAADRGYSRDAEEFLQEQLDRLRKQQMEIDQKNGTPEVAVDENEDLVNCEVVKSDILATSFADKDKGQQQYLYYDVALIKIDVKATYYGINVFYVMQLLFDKVKQIYILWTRWGRIGDFGQFQRTPFPTLVAAQIEFTKLFRQKTGNKWEDVNHYIKLPKKYSLRRISGKTVFKTQNMPHWVASDSSVDLTEVFIDFEKHFALKKSSLTKQELSFIRPLINSASMLRKAFNVGYENSLLWECLLDRRVMNQILDVLQELLKLAKRAEKLEEDKELFQEYAEVKERMFDLTNAYYELTTPTGFAFEKVKILDGQDEIGSEISSLLQLREVENASQLLLAAGKNLDKVNPYDFCYKNLKCDIKPIDTSSEDYELLMRYINSCYSHNKTTNNRQRRGYKHYKKTDYKKRKNFKRPAIQHKTPDSKSWVVSNIFQIKTDSSVAIDTKKRDHIFNGTHNHTMLFHGTSQANLISILEQGLCVQPSNASRHNGSAFGRGIYFADKFSLALNYSHSDKADDSLYVLVCEVALGNVMNSIGNSSYDVNKQGYFCTGDDFAKGYHSVRVMGSSGPNFDESWIQDQKTVDAQVAPIWPIGRVISYQNPFFRYKNNQYTKIEDLVAENKPGQAKKGKQPQKVAKKKKKQDSDDDDSNDDDEAEDDNADDELAKKLTKLMDKSESVNHIVANEIHHMSNPNDFNYSGFSYLLDDSQYIVANSDQVRVKYIIQVEQTQK